MHAAGRSWRWYLSKCPHAADSLLPLCVLQVHVKERLDGYKATHSLSSASEWKVRS